MSKPTNMLIKTKVVSEIYAKHYTLHQCIDKTAELIALMLAKKMSIEDSEKLKQLYNDTWREDMELAGSPTNGFFPISSYNIIQNMVGGMTPSQAAMMGLRWLDEL